MGNELITRDSEAFQQGEYQSVNNILASFSKVDKSGFKIGNGEPNLGTSDNVGLDSQQDLQIRKLKADLTGQFVNNKCPPDAKC